MLGERHEIARMQSDFYRDCYYAMLRFVAIEIGIMLLLILVIIYYVFFPVPQAYYASTTSGQIIPLTPAS